MAANSPKRASAPRKLPTELVQDLAASSPEARRSSGGPRTLPTHGMSPAAAADKDERGADAFTPKGGVAPDGPCGSEEVSPPSPRQGAAGDELLARPDSKGDKNPTFEVERRVRLASNQPPSLPTLPSTPEGGIDYSVSPSEGAKRLLQTTRGLPAFGIGDAFLHPKFGRMTVTKILGFEEGMTFGEEIKVHGFWSVKAQRDGAKRPEKVSFQVPDLTKEVA